LEKLYLVAAELPLLTAPHRVMVQADGLRQQVDPHWGLSHSKILIAL